MSTKSDYIYLTDIERQRFEALEQTCKSETIPGTGDQFSASNWRRLFQKLKENGFQLLQLQNTDN